MFGIGDRGALSMALSMWFLDVIVRLGHMHRGWYVLDVHLFLFL